MLFSHYSQISSWRFLTTHHVNAIFVQSGFFAKEKANTVFETDSRQNGSSRKSYHHKGPVAGNVETNTQAVAEIFDFSNI